MTKLALGFVALIACGDNTDTNPLNPDSSPDSQTPDSTPDGNTSFVVPTPFAVPLSVAGPDQLQSAAPGPEGSFYAAGFAAQTIASKRFVTVVRYLPTGSPDATFGANGVVTTPLEFVGGADEVDVAVQADGKILVSGTTPSPTILGDRDLGIVRLDPNGTLDATFGTAGVAVISLANAIMNGTTPTGADASRGLAVASTGEIFLHGASRGLGKKSADANADRTDTDYTVVKLTAAGVVDTTFGNQSITLGNGFAHANDTVPGQFRLDIQETGATPRALAVLDDGKLMVSGYANTPASASTTQPVLYKLTANGTLDTSWGADAQGVFHEVVVPLQTEVYNLAIHSDGTFTTAGYGRATGDANNFISLRFHLTPDAGANVRDLTYNSLAANGVLEFDPSGMALGSNCRNALALPNGKTLLMGSTGPSNLPAQDAVAAFVDETGMLDAAYGDGVHLFKLGADGNDQFWGATVSGSKAFVVGYQGGGAANAQTETTNDDAFAVIFDIQ